MRTSAPSVNRTPDARRIEVYRPKLRVRARTTRLPMLRSERPMPNTKPSRFPPDRNGTPSGAKIVR
jgi:hypothetical protein